MFSRHLYGLIALIVLLEVPRHLVKLLLSDLSPSVSFPEDVVGLVTVPPVSARTIPPPRPESPPDEPEDCEYPEEAKEPEWEEAEAVGIVAYWPEEDPTNRGDCRNHDYESQYSPEEEASWISPLMLT